MLKTDFSVLRFGSKPDNKQSYVYQHTKHQNIAAVQAVVAESLKNLNENRIHVKSVTSATPNLTHAITQSSPVDIKFNLGRRKYRAILHSGLAKIGSRFLELYADIKSDYEIIGHINGNPIRKPIKPHPYVKLKYMYSHTDPEQKHVWDCYKRKPIWADHFFSLPDKFAPSELVAQSQALTLSLTDKLVSHMTDDQKQLFDLLANTK